MAIRRYKAAGGVVIQTGMIDGLDPYTAFVLLLDRPDRGEVRLPKGHIDPGEEAHMAALRETEEEAGFVDLRILDDLGNQTVEFDYKGDHYIRDEHYYLMTLTSPATGQRPANDSAQFRVLWVPMEEAPARLTFGAEQSVTRKATHRYRALLRQNDRD